MSFAETVKDRLRSNVAIVSRAKELSISSDKIESRTGNYLLNLLAAYYSESEDIVRRKRSRKSRKQKGRTKIALKTDNSITWLFGDVANALTIANEFRSIIAELETEDELFESRFEPEILDIIRDLPVEVITKQHPKKDAVFEAIKAQIDGEHLENLINSTSILKLSLTNGVDPIADKYFLLACALNLITLNQDAIYIALSNVLGSSAIDSLIFDILGTAVDSRQKNRMKREIVKTLQDSNSDLFIEIFMIVVFIIEHAMGNIDPRLQTFTISQDWSNSSTEAIDMISDTENSITRFNIFEPTINRIREIAGGKSDGDIIRHIRDNISNMLSDVSE